MQKMQLMVRRDAEDDTGVKYSRESPDSAAPSPGYDAQLMEMHYDQLTIRYDAAP
jgi:hypothetical protein